MAASRKSVLVTGCSTGGIGHGLADVFHEKGYHVFVTLRNPAKTPQELSKKANVTVLTLDVLSSESITAAVESVKRETGGKLDVLVNNSGLVLFGPALDTPIEDGKKLFDLNFWAPIAMIQAFAPLLIKAKGCIVNNTSFNGIGAMPFVVMYNASKAALIAASETLRLELQPLGVRTVALITLGVKTKGVPGRLPTENMVVNIPETSQYYDIREFIQSLGDGRLQDSAISTREYATQVVPKIENGAVGMLWAGGYASALKWTWWLSPRFLRDKMVEGIIPVAGEMAKAAARKSKD